MHSITSNRHAQLPTLLALALLFLAPTVLAAPRNDSAADLNLLRAQEDLMGMEVRGSDGTAIGEIHDAILSSDDTTITHVVVSRGGFLGFGKSQHAIPWRALQIQQDEDDSDMDGSEIAENYVAINIDRDRLEQAPRFDGQSRPSATDDRFWGEGSTSSSMPANSAQTGETDELCLLSQVLDLNVQHTLGQDLGQIEEITIDAPLGRLAYATLSTGEFLDVGDRLVAVPWDIVRLDARRDVALVTVDKETLESEAYAKGQEPDLDDSMVARDLYARFGQEPYWTVFGYAAPAGRLSFENPQTVSGTIQRVKSTKLDLPMLQHGQPGPGHGAPAESGATGSMGSTHGGADVLLEIKTDTGDTVSVFVGPKSYMSRNGITLDTDDRVTIKGVKTQVLQEGEVLVAQEIRKTDGKTLTLFDAQGNPQWEQERNNPR